MKRNSHDVINQPGSKDPAFFYPKEFYVFDNFSSFQVKWKGSIWATSEHAFQAARFMKTNAHLVERIRKARSAHDAQKIAYENLAKQDPEWERKERGIMGDILRHKVRQHPYVLKKLLQSGNRIIIEDSWRDAKWGWGENKKGTNLLGKIWMGIRKEFKKKT